MKYNLIRKMDIANGPGVRISVFMQGCPFHCPNCFNPETWDFDGGKVFDDKVIEHIISLAKDDYIKGLSILGGEPMHPKNIEGTLKLSEQFKKTYPNKTIWVWTGYLFEQISKGDEDIKFIDVIVDGQFKQQLHNPKLKWRGSSNQRVIDVKKSLKQKKVVLFDN